MTTTERIDKQRTLQNHKLAIKREMDALMDRAANWTEQDCERFEQCAHDYKGYDAWLDEINGAEVQS